MDTFPISDTSPINWMRLSVSDSGACKIHWNTLTVRAFQGILPAQMPNNDHRIRFIGVVSLNGKTPLRGEEREIYHSSFVFDRKDDSSSMEPNDTFAKSSTWRWHRLTTTARFHTRWPLADQSKGKALQQSYFFQYFNHLNFFQTERNWYCL